MATLGDAWITVAPAGENFAPQLRTLVTAAERGLKVTIPVNADGTPALISTKALRDKMAALTAKAAELSVTLNDAAALAELVRLTGRLAALDKVLSRPQVTLRGLASTLGGIASVSAGLDELAAKAAATDGASLAGLSKSMAETGAATAAATAAANAWGGAWAFLGRQIPLFGGALEGILPRALTAVTGLHAVTDAIVEISAVVIPATIALGAFGFAGTDAANEIIARMTAAHTVLDATGQSIPGLKTGFEQLHDAVRPQVYQLFGDAITIVTAKAGAFSDIAKQTGTVVDQLAARFTYAVTSGGGFSRFMEHAVTDVQQLGDITGNLGGVFGNVFAVVPGYATALLSLADGLTKVLETATRVAEPVIAAGLALHGFVVYAGLAVTGTLALIGWIARLGAAFFTFGTVQVAAGWKSLVAFGEVLVNIGARLAYTALAFLSVAQAEGVMAAAGAALEGIFLANPFFWAAAAAVALGALVFWLSRSKDAAQQFNDTIEQAITNAPLMSLSTTIQQAQISTTTQLAGAHRDLTKALAEQGPQITGAASRFQSNYSPAVDHAAQSVQELAGAQQLLADQDALVNSRVAALAKTYGGNAAALSLLNAAGITSAQITDKNAQHWAQALIQIRATTAAYAAMGVQGGQLGNDLDVLGRTVTSQYQAVQKLNQGWSAFISDVTGSQGSFDTYAQGLSTLTGHAGTLHLTLGKLKVSYADTHAAIDSLTPAGIALNQAFADQITSTSKLYESWRTAGLANNLFTAGVKDSIAPLVTYASGSQEATAQLIALAQQAGYQGPVAMKALVQWLGNTRDATQNLKDITDQATVQEALLTGAMQAQGSYIASTLIGDINNAILKYDGVRAAATAYGNAVAKSGAQSDAAHAARKTLTDDLIAAGTAAGDSAGQIAAMIAKVLGIPSRAAMQIVMTGDGSYTIKAMTSAANPYPGGISGRAAAGLYLHPNAGIPGRDSLLLRAMPGELVVPSNMTEAVRPVLGGKIPGFAAGGIPNPLLTGNTRVLTGQYAVDFHAQVQAQMTAALVAAMRAGLKTAEAAATGTRYGGGIGYAPGPAATGNAAAAQAYAKSILWAYGWGPGQFPPLQRLWNQESGWNPYAVNPSSGAYGIPQALGHGHPYNLGDYANQVRWGLAYISGRYGSPAAAWSHEQAFNWYDKGGWLPPGISMAVNRTGHPERVVPPGGDDVAALLRQTNALLREQNALLQSNPAALGAVLNGVASRSASRGYYGMR